MNTNINTSEEIASLRKELEILQWIVANSPGNVFWWDMHGTFMGCNKNTARTLQLSSPEEIIGKTNIEVLGKSTAAYIDQINQEVVLKQHEISVEETAWDENRNLAIYLTKKMPLRDSKNNMIGIIGTSFNITDRKQMEEELKLAKERAEQTSEEKSEFITNMSHDVKTPLSGIISIAEVLAFRLTGENKDLALLLLDAGQQLLKFFNSCIELFKFEAQALPTQPAGFSIQQLLEEIDKLYRPAILAKNLDFHIHCDNTIPRVLIGNYAGVYRVLLNLIGNAIKFTEEGHIQVRIQHHETTTNGTALIDLIVEDTGVGIPKNKQTAIFDRFTRLNPSYKGTYDGSGIGLYVVRKLVENMNGTILVHSEEKSGSQFVATIPFSISKDHLQTPTPPIATTAKSYISKHPSKPSSSIEETANAGSIRILLVEDNEMIQKATVILLRSIDCHVTVAESGEKALELFEPGQFDLIFLDIGLPGLQGDSIAKLIRKMEAGCSHHVPIVALTAHISEEQATHFQTQGIDRVISKPMSLENAQDIIKQLIH